ncbi:site-2 protease family protein [candidate division GN15 bacterium]|nr:site-2 protease family protein [candidate division GN15 bacterium]
MSIPAFLLALTVHEYFHAWMANRLGDSTARQMGRLTLNPIAHLDVMGTIVIVVSNFTFGWAKPVPVNPYNLRNPKRDDLLISAAGPFSNLGLAVLFAVFFWLAGAMSLGIPAPVLRIIDFTIWINVVLAFFNLIPVFPLDGSHILRSLLPDSMGPTLDQFERVGPFILLGLLIFGGIWYIIGTPIMAVYRALVGF